MKCHIRGYAVTSRLQLLLERHIKGAGAVSTLRQWLECLNKSRRFVNDSRFFQQCFRSEVETLVKKCVDLFLSGIEIQFGSSFV